MVKSAVTYKTSNIQDLNIQNDKIRPSLPRPGLLRARCGSLRAFRRAGSEHWVVTNRANVWIRGKEKEEEGTRRKKKEQTRRKGTEGEGRMRKKKEEGKRKKEEGRRKKEEGRMKKEDGRRKKEEGRRKKE